MRHNAKITVVCPECEASLRVEVSPAWPGVRYYRDGSGSPPEPAEIEDVVGQHTLPCSYASEDDDDKFYDHVMEALAEEEQAAMDAEADSRMERERERERVHDWERYPTDEGGPVNE